MIFFDTWEKIRPSKKKIRKEREERFRELNKKVDATVALMRIKEVVKDASVWEKERIEVGYKPQNFNNVRVSPIRTTNSTGPASKPTKYIA